MLAKYQTTRHAEEALLRLKEAYLALGIVSEAQTAAAILGHNFPDSPWYKDAYARCRQGGFSRMKIRAPGFPRSFMALAKAAATFRALRSRLAVDAILPELATVHALFLCAIGLERV